MISCDVIVVGAGPAGCLVASQLARRTDRRILLLEPPSQQAPLIDHSRPARWLNLLGSGEDWAVKTMPCQAIAGRALQWPRGKGIGGSTRINAMIWFPPTQADLHALVAAGGTGWSASTLRDSLASVESLVRPERPSWISESSRHFLRAVDAWDRAEPMVYRRFNRQGHRWTAAELLTVAEDRVRILRATADRILFHGDNAIGVVTAESPRQPIHSRCGVVLCAGAISSPAILMRSGIGPAQVLRAAGVPLKYDSPRVGEGLQDHMIMPVVFRLASSRRFAPRASTRDLARWQILGCGPLSSNLAECGGLFEDGKVQLHVTPTHYYAHPKPSAPAAMTIGANVSRPASQGRLTITSGDPLQPPTIDAQYFSHEEDLIRTIDGVRLCRRIASSSPLMDWHQGELMPGDKRIDDDSIARSIARYALTLFHPVGTCGLGADPANTVDQNFRVRGTANLWLADAAALPHLTCGNPTATVLMLAHHGATLIEDSLRD